MVNTRMKVNVNEKTEISGQHADGKFPLYHRPMVPKQLQKGLKTFLKPAVIKTWTNIP